MSVSILGARVIDPASQMDTVTDIHVQHGRITCIGPSTAPADCVIDARGLVACPGLVDLCARLREPGLEHKATIASETRAAVAGGITTLCLPPDTTPVVDEPAVVELIRRRSAAAESCKVVIVGALTRNLAGETLSEMAALRDAGCVAVSNAWNPVTNTLVMRRALEYAATFDLTVFLHALDPWLARDGCIHEGAVATRLGLPGIPVSAETAYLARDLALIEEIGVRAHFCRLSSARGAEMVGEAIARGLPVSADVCAHQLHLTDADAGEFDSQCHVNPPLRTGQDRAGLRNAVEHAIVTAVCSDHQPHEPDAKLNPFGDTEPGISALETLLSLTLEASDPTQSLLRTLAPLTIGPARILGVEAGSLAPGAPADVCVFDPHQNWQLIPGQMLSRGRNTPFAGRTLTGRVLYTLVDGRVVYEANRSPQDHR